MSKKKEPATTLAEVEAQIAEAIEEAKKEAQPAYNTIYPELIRFDEKENPSDWTIHFVWNEEMIGMVKRKGEAFIYLDNFGEELQADSFNDIMELVSDMYQCSVLN